MNTIGMGEHGTIIFDGSCEACSQFIGSKSAYFQKHGFTVVPLQERSVRDLTGLDEDALSKAIHLITPTKTIYRGIEVVEFVTSKIWYLLPVHLVLSISYLRPFFAKIYDYIAQRRLKISKVCGLQSKALYKSN